MSLAAKALSGSFIAFLLLLVIPSASAATGPLLVQQYSTSYTGTGASTSTIITLPFTPTYVYIFKTTGIQFAQIVGNSTKQSLFTATGAGSFSGDIQSNIIVTNGVDVGLLKADDSVGNDIGATYYLIASNTGGASLVPTPSPTGSCQTGYCGGGSVSTTINTIGYTIPGNTTKALQTIQANPLPYGLIALLVIITIGTGLVLGLRARDREGFRAPNSVGTPGRNRGFRRSKSTTPRR